MSLYLIPGGAGFIGSNIAEALLKEGHRVRILDNFSTGKRSNVPADAELFELDFTDLASIRPAFEGVDGVFLTGALPRIPYSIDHPVESAQANVFGTLNVLVAARDAKVKRVVYSASSSAYGGQETLPLHPDMPANPLNPYALHKYIGEKNAEHFAKFYGLETVSLRYFNVYGPRMADEGAYVTVISHFVRQKKAGASLTVHGDGEQTRDFTHVADVVRANMLAMASPRVGKGEVVNVGAGQNFSINHIAAIVGGPVEYHPGRVGEARHTRADITRTKELLEWEPTVEFEEGLREYLRLQGIEPGG
ncbi:NAD-dependent epimerase/dehydratase family protein [Patescibacteria group bacterium]|nr:NAD-dependent epimerase/dehydratase family protein [Patescibacteria group bacterium]MBU1448499.1 NAD-dependent epimerase/dehydratase family protein [Patescibacteria group bacterium]